MIKRSKTDEELLELAKDIIINLMTRAEEYDPNYHSLDVIADANDWLKVYDLEDEDEEQPYKYNVGDTVMNETNWTCYIIKRYRNTDGENCYLVESEDDSDLEEDEDGNIPDPNNSWELKEDEIKYKK